MNLYEISKEYQETFLALADMELEEDVFNDTISGIEGELELKGQNVAAFIGNLDAQAAAIKDAEAKMAARRKSIENKAAHLREYLRANMEACGITKIECPWFAVSIKKNPKSVVIDGTVPDEYLVEKVTKSPDKKAIKAAIEGGKVLPWAHVEQKTRLDIK